MTTKSEKMLNDFYQLCQQNNQQNPSLQNYLKSKASQLFDSTHEEANRKINWKDELIEAYSQMKVHDASRLKITVVCEELISEFQKTIKNKDLQLQMFNNELAMLKSSLEQEKLESLKLQKEHEHALFRQNQNTIRALQKVQQKEYEIRDLEEKISQYEQQIEEIKSSQYQNMINSIKEEEIMNSQAQNLYKENTLLKYQLKEENLLRNQLSRHIKTLTEEIDHWKSKYDNARLYISNKIDSKRLSEKYLSSVTITRDTKQQQQQTINLIEFKDDFSFKDSIENENNSTIVHNNVLSILDLESNSEFHFGTQQSPQRCLMERDVLNLTDRDRSTQSRNVTRHLIRSKKRYLAQKQNISQNTWEYNELDQYNHDNKISNFGSKCQQMPQQNINSNCSIGKYAPSPRGFGTQQRSSLLSKHRRIKSSFCGKSIQEFHEYENNHFIVNSQKLKQSIFEQSNQKISPLKEESGEQKNNFEDESSITAYDVNEIVINEQLITSHKSRIPTQNTPQMFSSVEAKMITSVQVLPIQPMSSNLVQKAPQASNPSPDIYYAFFSLTAQCAKLNAKNFNRAISVYFNLEQEYNNVIKKTIPINKWYNYINDQLQTAIKYMA